MGKCNSHLRQWAILPMEKWAEDTKRGFSKNEIEISLKLMKRYQNGYVFRETNLNNSETKFAPT